MTQPIVKLGGPDTDNAADEEIRECLNPLAPKSFFLFAGAGSGKTRSLKSALESFRETHGANFRRDGKKIAVITFTNAAADEISERVGADALFPISTIHSFCWQLIDGFYSDIRLWLLAQLPVEFAEIQARHAKGRAGKAADDRINAMAAINRRMEWLQVPRRFVYNPNGNNFGADSLSHAEVIKISASFLQTKISMQEALVDRYPFLLIDESQDTNKELLAALFELEKKCSGRFGLGLFGDTMQRIYFDGQPKLGQNIPPTWAQPQKQMNHRSVQRVIALANAFRAEVDKREQLARDDSKLGTARLFIGLDSSAFKPALEMKLRERMAETTQDPNWRDTARVKTLTLEHHMAASRSGFLKMFQALDKSSSLSTGLRSGELAGIRLFTEYVVPLVDAYRAGNKFAVLNILRAAKSPLLSRLTENGLPIENDPLKAARHTVDSLVTLVEKNVDVSFLEVLKNIAESGLFDVPQSLKSFVMNDPEAIEKAKEMAVVDGDGQETSEDEKDLSPSILEAWEEFLNSPYSQILPYADYVADKGPYGTHQGVKGLQFERVLVILDDGEAKGRFFSYGKLFGIKPLTENDRLREAEGDDTGNDRTRRLLYVTCTRAEQSLAIVVYVDQREALADYVIKRGWFQRAEIEMLD